MLGTATTPLEDIFPHSASTILITDSVEQEGRFILQAWVSDKKSVLWLAGGPPPLGSKTDIRCIPAEIALEDQFDPETFTKQLLVQINEWVDQQTDEPWIVLDDVSVLSALLGSRLIYALVLSLQAENRKLMIRCSHETEVTSSSSSSDAAASTWIGAGGVVEEHIISKRQHWETALVDLADWVVDVFPMQSGYTREAQGRIVLGENTGKRSLAGYNFIFRDGKPVVTLV